MCAPNASYLAKHSESGSKILNKICLRIIQKSLQIAITACKFSKIFRESMPPHPPRAFLVSQSFSNLFYRKKKRFKEIWKLWLPPFKISRYATVYDQKVMRPARAVAAAPQTPQLGGGPHCQKGPQIVLKDPKLHQFKNKVLLGESR